MSFKKNLTITSSLTAVTAAVGTAVTDPDTLWYKLQRKPRWQPPTWLFLVAWTGLYASIAGSSARVLTDIEENTPSPANQAAEEANQRERQKFLAALAINLGLNAGWSALFWKGQNNTVSTIEAAALAASSIDLARRAGKVNPKAGLALVPYAAWTSFATVLTGAIAKRN